jgi:hypothetical protein
MSISELLNNIIDKFPKNYEESKVIILENKNDSYPLIHVLYDFYSQKYDGKDKIAIKFYPLVYFSKYEDSEILINNNYNYKDTENYFQIVFNHIYKTAVLNSSGDGFFILPEKIKNFGLGSFAFYKLISLALDKGFGSYSLNKQTIGGDEKDAYQRFMFYLKHGLSLSSEAVKTEGKKGEYFASSLKNIRVSLPRNILFDFNFDEYERFLSIYNNDVKNKLEKYLSK